MSKLNPSYPSKSSTKHDIKQIHHDSNNSTNAKNSYNIYRANAINHMDQMETKQYHKQQRQELNQRIQQFSLEHYGFSPEAAEKFIYFHYQPYMAGLKIYRNRRVKSDYGYFDIIIRESINISK